MGDPTREGEFVENIQKGLDLNKSRSDWDWVEKAISENSDKLVLRETVKAICSILKKQREDLDAKT